VLSNPAPTWDPLQFMPRLARSAASALRSPDLYVALAFAGGLLSLAVGCALIYLPAGLIVGGLAAAASALFYARGG